MTRRQKKPREANVREAKVPWPLRLLMRWLRFVKAFILFRCAVFEIFDKAIFEF